MARKKVRVPSPSPPPPTPPREDSSSDEEEDEAEATPVAQKAPQDPKPPSTDADSSDGGDEESSDSETDANAFQRREVAPSTGKPSGSDAADEDGGWSESPEPVQKKAARKPKAETGKKRRAAESSPSSRKAKKAKADVEKAAAPSELNTSSKGKKQRGKAVPDGLPSKPVVRRWTTEDEIKVLEALVSHVKANGTQPSAVELIAAVGNSLERKGCTKTEMYEKVRNLKQRHQKAASTGFLPANEEDRRKFNLSEAVWAESAKEVAAVTISQNGGASSKHKKGQINKEKAKEAAPVDTPVKSKIRGNHEEELEDDAKADLTKETTNADTQNGGTSKKKNGGTSVRSKRGKSDKGRKHGDAEGLRAKEAMEVTQNDDALFENGEPHEDKMDIDPNVKNVRERLVELQNLYANLSSYVESIHAQHPCGEAMKRAFEKIPDEKACALEAKIKKQRVAEMKMDIRLADTKKEVTNLIIGLLE